MIDSMPGQEKRLDIACNERQLNQKRQVRLKTCADVYDHWRSYKRSYKKAPNDGVEFQIDYIDTGLALNETERSRAPIALALHGAPGSYHDFSLLISHLTKQKVRVIAPNFPEYIATVKTKVLFRHSADEKAAYLRDFLKAINVKRIDLLVSHSSAIFPTLLILLNANNEALARQRQQQQQQTGATRDGSGTPKRAAATNNGSVERGDCQGGRVVSVESFSEIGNQLRGNVVELVDKSNSGTLPRGEERAEATGVDSKALEQQAEDEDGDEAEREGEEEGEGEGEEEEGDNETFVDAAEEIDGNNNRRQIEASTGTIDQNGNQKILAATAEIGAKQNASVVGAPTKDFESIQRNDGDELARRRKHSEGRHHGRRRRQLDVIVQFDEPIEIRAVALFNPAGHRLPKSMKPTWFKCGSVHVYQHKLGRSLFRKFGPGFLTVVGVPVRVDNMDNVMLSATVMRNSKCQRVVNQLEQLSQMKIPTLLVFSENDKLIEKEIFYEMTQFMRLDSKNFDVFNNDGDIELSRSSMEDWIRVMVFKAGGHYAYSNYANTVNKAVSELLSKVTSTKCSN